MTEDTITLKRLRAEDAALLSAVATQAYSDHYLHLWHDGGQWYLQTYFTPARFEEEVHDANAWFFLVYLHGEAVGFLKLNMNKPSPCGGLNALELERIYLTKQASGRGIGTHLLQVATGIARQQGNEQLWLKVMDSSEGAIRFYEKAGFQTCGTYRLPFQQMKEAMRGMYVMQKNV